MEIYALLIHHEGLHSCRVHHRLPQRIFVGWLLFQVLCWRPFALLPENRWRQLPGQCSWTARWYRTSEAGSYLLFGPHNPDFCGKMSNLFINNAIRRHMSSDLLRRVNPIFHILFWCLGTSCYEDGDLVRSRLDYSTQHRQNCVIESGTGIRCPLCSRIGQRFR